MEMLKVTEAQIEGVYAPKILRETKLRLDNPNIHRMEWCAYGLLVYKNDQQNPLLIPPDKVKWATIEAPKTQEAPKTKWKPSKK